MTSPTYLQNQIELRMLFSSPLAGELRRALHDGQIRELSLGPVSIRMEVVQIEREVSDRPTAEMRVVLKVL